ncbi:MAG TPA: SIMPL domain-containing protein [Gammaproteobacteria bacterium]|nr:SIMPL domain-containing protein [Gammaproteobacteria bacterium]
MRYRNLICLLALGLIGAPAVADNPPAVPFVQVSGHGEVRVAPDRLEIALAVTRTDTELATARADVERRAGKVLAAAKKLGMAPRDVDAHAIRIEPEYTWQNNQRKYVGERVTRDITLTLRDVSRYPALLDALVGAGVNSVTSVTPSRSDVPVLRRQALAAAMQDARARAGTLADSAQVTLGSVFSISETPGYNAPPGPQPLMMRATGTRSATPADYEPGLITISEDVAVTYLLDLKH